MLSYKLLPHTHTHARFGKVNANSWRASNGKTRGHKSLLNVVTLAFAMLLLSTSLEARAANPEQARKIVPIIMLLLDDPGENDSILEVDTNNPDVYSSDDFPNGVTATFAGVSDALVLGFQVNGLKPGETLTAKVNGELLGVISSNGVYEFEIPNSLLFAGARNILELVANPAGATWTISGISLTNDEGPHTRAEAVRFLTKATFGADPDSIERLLELGYSAWVDEQLRMSPTLHLPFYQQNVIERTAAGINVGATQRCSSKMDAWFNGAVSGEDQLQQRMAFALSQIFVVGDFACDSVAEQFPGYYDILVNGATGSYRDLLENVTLSPVMGSWLSLRGSRALSDTTSPDENFAREVMQLFSIGVNELNLDGSLKLQNGQPIDTYDNEIVHDIARALTGWNWDSGRYYLGVNLVPMTPWNGLYSWFHDHGEKTILNGVVIPEGYRDPLAHLKDEEDWLHSGNHILDDLEMVLDTISAHDNVAPFISKQLIQRFVSSNPSPEYIERVARVFNNNGSGERGDLGAVVKAVLLDEESLNSYENEVSGGKLKEPLIRVTQIWRAFEAQSPVKYIRYLQVSRDFGQRPMGASSVFNFYRPDYAPLGEIADQGLVAPEFTLTGDAQLLVTYPAMQDILDSLITIDDDDIFNGSYTDAQNVRMVLDLTQAKSVSDNTSALMNYFNDLLFGGLMSDRLRNRVEQYIDDEVVYEEDLTDDERRHKKVEEALFLLGVSPDFSVQR